LPLQEYILALWGNQVLGPI